MIKQNIEKLTWDSNFWGIDIYNCFCYQDLDLNQIESKEYIIQKLLPSTNFSEISLLENRGFNFIEDRITLNKKITKEKESNFDNINDIPKSEIENIDINEMQNLFKENSRFKSVNSEKVGSFYYLWLKNSNLGQLDNFCKGIYTGDNLSGFMTYSIKDESLIIGLFGIFEPYQRMGLGQTLLNYVTNEAFKFNCKKISVVTQLHNISAMNTYIKNGFYIDNISKWYYLKGEL